jgi:hypothetical protein
MPRKPKLDVNRREVRETIRKTGGNQADVDRPSTATGRKAERIAARLQNASSDLPRQNSRDQMQSKGQRGKTRKLPKAA